MTFARGELVVSVEHATNRVPKELGTLGLEPHWLEGHHAWDPGAAIIGRAIAKHFGAPLHLGTVSRLVTDLNRSAPHPRLCARNLRPEGVPVPANEAMDRTARVDRRERYWRPWREAVERDLDAAVARHGHAFHLSIHSFTGSFGDTVRTQDFGLMYGPKHQVERELADRVDDRLAERGYTSRRNWPYSGLDDGFCMRMRAERDWSEYVGFEIETNQDTVGSAAGARRFAKVLIEVLEPEFGVRDG